MTVLVTGAFGRVGTALINNQSRTYDYKYFDRREHANFESTIGDLTDYSTLSGAIEDTDEVVHLAAASNVDAEWQSVLQDNIIGTYNCLEACRSQGIESVVLASTNHVVGMYEKDHAPDIYNIEYDMVLDNQTPVRPDSYYATSKIFVEALGRYYVENYEYPKHVYVLRFGSIRNQPYNHPYGDAERGVKKGKWEPDSDAYQRSVQRMKATWQSMRDAAQLIECCLQDNSVEFDIFYGVSDNDRRWFDIQHARSILNYEPQDNAEEWDNPPDTI